MDELMTQEEFEHEIYAIADLFPGEWSRLATTAYAAVLARIASLEAERRWIPVSERLPEKSGRYWVITDHDPLDPVERQYYVGLPDPWGYLFSEVTHWMPLPCAPNNSRHGK